MSGSTNLPVTPINHAAEGGTAPKAYLNYIFINRDFDPASIKVLFDRLEGGKENGSNVSHDSLYIPPQVITEPGYVYIYLSNDNLALGGAQVEVYFDDFKVEQVKSPVVSSQSYYPFGLTFDSYSRENSLSNEIQFNSKEKQDELSLGWLDFGARMYMPDIARWTTIDPLAERSRRWSPYAFAFNNPTRFMDPDGMEGEDKTQNPGPSRREKRQAIREQRREIRQAKRDGGPGADTRIAVARGNISGIRDAYRNGTPIGNKALLVHNTPGDDSSFAGSIKTSGATGLPLNLTTQQAMTKKVSTTVSGSSSGAGTGEHHSDPIAVPAGTQTASMTAQAYTEPDKFTVTDSNTGSEILTTDTDKQNAVSVGPAPTGSATSVQVNVTQEIPSQTTMWNYKVTFNGTAPANGNTGVKVIKE